MKTFVSGILLLFTSVSLAQTLKPAAPKEINKEDLPPMASPIDEKQEEFKEKARKRLYPGGIDEEDLRVQADLPRPEKSVSGAATPGAKPELEHEGF